MTSDTPEPFPGHDGGAWQPVPCEIVAAWPPGHFAENLVAAASGDVFVSLHSHNRIERFQPASCTVSTFVELPAPVAGLAFDRAGTVWATGGQLGQPPGYVWRIQPDGSFTVWLEVPDARFMNGCTLHRDSEALLVCESATGRVLSVDLHEPTWRPWIADDRLRPATPQMPGANGIKLFGDDAYISVTDSNRIFRVAVQSDGSAGPLTVHADNLRADDFAFSRQGSLYIATHPAQTVMCLTNGGERTTIAGPAEGAVGATACAFGRTAADAEALYVTTSGGLFAPYRGALQEAKLLRLHIAEAGTPDIRTA